MIERALRYVLFSVILGLSGLVGLRSWQLHTLEADLAKASSALTLSNAALDQCSRAAKQAKREGKRLEKEADRRATLVLKQPPSPITPGVDGMNKWLESK